MIKFIHIFTALMTVSFGIGGYLAPAMAFEPFGFVLDQTGINLAKGYASAALGYGLIFWFTRNVTEPTTSRSLLIASVAFNGLEAFLQLPIAFQGLAKAPIWVTAGSHTLLAMLSLLALLRSQKK